MSAATQPKQAPIPALMTLPSIDLPSFWPVVALNADAELQALQALRSATAKKSPTTANYTARIALTGAILTTARDAANAFDYARSNGVLLYAWRGSKALVQALPTCRKGGAA